MATLSLNWQQEHTKQVNFYHEPAITTNALITTWLIACVLLGAVLAMAFPLDGEDEKYLRPRQERCMKAGRPQLRRRKS